jgi:hypothetical protein
MWDKPLYFPFELGLRSIGPIQGYLFKPPIEFLSVFGIQAPAQGAATLPEQSVLDRGLVKITGQPTSERPWNCAKHFATDPAIVGRGIRGHAITQNALAAYLQSVSYRFLGVWPLPLRG